MCGFAGFTGYLENGKDVLTDMMNKIIHRGPDSAGQYIDDKAYMGIFLAMESYRLERLQIWQHPEKYEKGYQTLQGLYAIGSGGLFGRGLGSSIQKLGFVPEAQNDMIFSIICRGKT